MEIVAGLKCFLLTLLVPIANTMVRKPLECQRTWVQFYTLKLATVPPVHLWASFSTHIMTKLDKIVSKVPSCPESLFSLRVFVSSSICTVY